MYVHCVVVVMQGEYNPNGSDDIYIYIYIYYLYNIYIYIYVYIERSCLISKASSIVVSPIVQVGLKALDEIQGARCGQRQMETLPPISKPGSLDGRWMVPECVARVPVSLWGSGG